MLKEFKEFALKGNIMDMAVGVVLCAQAKIFSNYVELLVI